MHTDTLRGGKRIKERREIKERRGEGRERKRGEMSKESGGTGDSVSSNIVS